MQCYNPTRRKAPGGARLVETGLKIEMGHTATQKFNRPGLLALLGKLGVRGFLWRAYCRCFGPRGGIIHLQLGPQKARFYAHSEWVARDLATFGGEQELLQLLISLVRPGDVVYDIGANMGIHAVFLGQAVGTLGRILAFEPEPHYCERLRGNTALNDVQNVRVFCLALGDHAHLSELLPSERGTAAPRLAENSATEGAEPKGQSVQVIEGDSLIESENLPTPRMVKIDVEGHEYAVLRGLRRTLTDAQCQIVCCEVHPDLLPEGVGSGEILNLLKSCGFNRIEVLPRPPQDHVMAYKEAEAASSRT